MYFSELVKYAKSAGLDCEVSNHTHENVYFNEIFIDNRLINQAQHNTLFVCIKGENQDGHTFAHKAIEDGAVALIANKDSKLEVSVPVLYVDDSAKALEKIAHAKRLEFQGKVIAITGTAGKTSVKEMLWQVLLHKGKAAKNYLNFNTQIGVSLSILNAIGDEDFWVLEAGISHEHDMDEIGAIICPDIALILNAGLGHAEGLPKGAAHYKAKLFNYLKDSTSIALASADYPELVKETKEVFPRTNYFTTQENTLPFRANYIETNEEGKGSFRVYIMNENFLVQAPLRSQYGAENVIAVSMIASLCGMSSTEIQEAFMHIVMPIQRFDVHNFENVTVIDDSYNANPLSFRRMLEAATEYTKPCEQYPRNRALICLVGAMYELGNIAEREHEKLGEEFAQKLVQSVHYIGDYAENFKKGLQAQMPCPAFFALNGSEDFAQTLALLNAQDTVFLVKGSRSNKLETYVKELIKFYG